MTKIKTKNKRKKDEKANTRNETLSLAGEKVISSHKLQLGIT